jgi:DeoR family fructose operon transcriptional repressor
MNVLKGEGNNMLTEERLNKILAMVEKNKSVSISQLMTSLQTSESTVRRDLAVLHRRNKLIKVRGGAISLNAYDTQDDTVPLRKERNLEEKTEIARYAASLVEPNDFVFIDAGTTTELVIDFLIEKNVTFVTNAVGHAKRLSQLGYTTFILGGEFKATTEAIVGVEAVESLSKYNFTKGFLGSNGVSVTSGFSTPDVREAMVKKRAMEKCKDCYVLCDSSKFSKISSVTFADFSAATIITTQIENEIYLNYKNIIEVTKNDLHSNV